MEPSVVATSCTGVMYLLNYVANFKAMDPRNHPKEDSKLGLDDAAGKAFEDRLSAQGGVDRWTRVAQNQKEQFCVALGVFWTALLAPADVNKMNIAYCFLTYLVARVIFILFYLGGLSPWRSVAFLTGQFSVFAAAGFGIAGCLSNQLWLIAMVCATTFFALNFVARLLSVDPTNHPPEDKVFGGPFIEDAKTGYQNLEKGFNRWHRIAENQGEQFPIAFMVLLSVVKVRGDDISGYCLLAYLVCRLLFIVCYLFALAPWRSIAHFGGTLTVVTSGILGIMFAVDQSASTDASAVAIIATTVTVLMFVTSTVALLKGMNPSDHPAEDAKLGMNEDAKEAYLNRLDAQGGVDRWGRIAANQMENFPMDLYVLWVAIFSGVGINAAYCFGAYYAFRFLFVICYLFGLSPWRSIAFLLGHAAIITAAVFSILAAKQAAEV